MSSDQFTIDRRTGALLYGDDDLYQSIEDILTTPKGSRLFLRSYGCRLLDLLDKNVSPARLAGEVSDAIEEFEKRVKVKSAVVRSGPDGKVEISLSLERISGGAVSFEVNLGR